jgi:hypothetical protein
MTPLLPRILLSAALAAALALPAAAQVRANRFVTVDNQTFGYVQLSGQAVAFPNNSDDAGPGTGFRPGLAITILTRNGAPVSQADEAAAFEAARLICTQTRRQFDTRARGRMLARGGILFAGACG